MTLKNNRALLLSNIKLYASFHYHMWIQTRVTVWKWSSQVVTSETLTFDLWPWPFAWTLLWSLVITPENFMMIRWWEHSQKGVTDRQTDGQTDGQTENTICRAAWLQLKNNRVPLLYNFKLCASFQSHRWIKTWVTVPFLSRVTLKFNGWPWKITGHLFYSASSFVHHFIAISDKQTGVSVRKRQIWVKIDDFLSRATLIFDRWPWKTIGHLFYATPSVVYHFKAIGEFNLELQPGNAKFGSNSTIFF